MEDYQKLFYPNQETFIAYRKSIPKIENKYGIIFLCGFNSDMNGTKAQAVAKHAESKDYDFIRFDYTGTGSSSGDFVDGSIHSWLKDTLYVIDNLTDKPQILVGSSMGGWIMLLAALARPEKIAGLVGLAAAPDFTEELIFSKLSEEQKQELDEKNKIFYNNEYCTEPYLISKKLIGESKAHILLDKKMDINVPIHLIHGMQDEDVPFNTAIRIAEKVTSENVKITLLKNGGHRLSNPKELDFIFESIDEFVS